MQEAMETTTIQLDKWESRTLTFLIADSIGPLWRSECQRKRIPSIAHNARVSAEWRSFVVRRDPGTIRNAALGKGYPEINPTLTSSARSAGGSVNRMPSMPKAAAAATFGFRSSM